MKIHRGGFIPNLCTLGNGVCGFAALMMICRVDVIERDGVATFSDPRLFTMAAWLILLGMVFDVFDGQLARLTGRTSNLGAQLDSLCDLITFGMAPAALVIALNQMEDTTWQKVVWFFSLAYFLGALLRLARFNVENEHDESAHLCFKGLPTPAAAGCVASLVIFYRYILDFNQRELVWLGGLGAQDVIQSCVNWIPGLLPILVLVLGYTMVSVRLNYEHLASRLFNRGQSFDVFVYLIFASVLAAVIPELVLPAVFIGYLASTPLMALVRHFRHAGRRRKVTEEVRQGTH